MNSQFFLNRIIRKQQRKAEKDIAIEARIQYMMENSNASRQDCNQAIELSRLQSVLLVYMAIASLICGAGKLITHQDSFFIAWLFNGFLVLVGMIPVYFPANSNRLYPTPPLDKPAPPPNPPNIIRVGKHSNPADIVDPEMPEAIGKEIEDFKREQMNRPPRGYPTPKPRPK